MNDKTPTIMIVEDEVLVGIMLARKLRTKGFDVGEVLSTGEEAIERAEIEKPDVVLMDITLAGKIDGLEAADTIQTDFNIPVIIFTGYDSTTIKTKTTPVAILSKMGPLEDIIQAITTAVGD